MNRVGRNEDRIPRSQNSILLIDPLLEFAGDHYDHFFLVRMLVKVMSLAGIQFGIKDSQTFSAGARRVCKEHQPYPSLGSQTQRHSWP